MSGWSTGEVAGILGTSFDNISYYARSGFVLPTVEAGRGRGGQRRYGFNDLVAMAMLRASRPLDVSLAALKPLLKMVQEHEDLSEVETPVFAFIDGCCHGIVYDLQQAHGSGCSIVFDLRLLADRILKRVSQ